MFAQLTDEAERQSSTFLGTGDILQQPRGARFGANSEDRRRFRLRSPRIARISLLMAVNRSASQKWRRQLIMDTVARDQTDAGPVPDPKGATGAPHGAIHLGRAVALALSSVQVDLSP